MLRSEVLNQLLGLFTRPRYLEVGVHSGETFLAVRAAHKVAVDPLFRFDVDAAARAEPSAEFHAVTSDAYFRGLAPDAPPFDVVFLDGLHTFEQTLRDLMNALAHTRPDSVIVIDDVKPNGFPAAIRDLGVFDRLYAAVPGTDAAWMGDVYRLVWFVSVFMPAWSYATVAENHGQLVLWRRTRDGGPETTVEAVARTPYEDVVLHGEVFRSAPLAEILAQVRAARGPSAASTSRASTPPPP